ncbi:hypothetical protein TG4357_02655 [Thalassovita gelatinovora]|uniref:Lambda phage tail tube protein N-terminal domain-containing protein n=1 Tax=Thalassovita gelatinovora TaxID=53501 RepID=A0A0P1G3H8_THAGE|nr:phage tail tube protein [Thalassovita gelatinovora]QIZ79780.1 hypothetical protein HFZ77_04440 [Thalassovita gelatinovora]CUH66814.1 hypothetical protein TG4357_02655 [Thalassovita gelatinovora]SEQ43237.1 hypothetical protein SAMN04488043_105192 [Thalassovita gelatinovora]
MPVSSGAVRGHGSFIRIGRGETPAWTKLVGVEEFDFPDQTPDDIDVTHLESPGDTEEVMPGMNKASSWKINVHHVPGGDTETLLADLAETKEHIILEINVVGAAVAKQFVAYVNSYRPTGIKSKDKMMAEVSLAVMAKVDPLVT